MFAASDDIAERVMFAYPPTVPVDLSSASARRKVLTRISALEMLEQGYSRSHVLRVHGIRDADLE